MAASKTNPIYVDADNDIRAHQEFILHLLKQGKDTWNESRAFDYESKSDFSAVVFHKDLNLDGYVFGQPTVTRMDTTHSGKLLNTINSIAQLMIRSLNGSQEESGVFGVELRHGW